MKFILLTAIFFCTKVSFAAQSQISILDTSGPKEEYKLSRKGFLEKYGKDDSSRALINFYFKKRTSGKIGVFTLGTSAIFFGTVSDLILNATDEGFGADIAKTVFGGVALALFITSSIFLIIAAITWIKYSRKMLLTNLNDYFDGKPISRKTTRSHLFKKIMRTARK